MSNGFSFGDFRSKLNAAFKRIGTTNGLKAPHTSSNIDPIMHEYLVASDGVAFYTKRRTEALAALADVYDVSTLEDAVTRVVKTDSGEEFMLAEGEAYALSVKLNRPANRFDQTALKNELMKSHGMTAEQITKLFDKCTKQTAPSKRFTVVGR